jgi:glutamine synthetase
MQRRQDYVLRSVEERGIRYIQLWFTDVLGIRRGFSITPAELENALEEGMTFDGSAVDGFSRVQEADVLALPDAGTFQILPWRTDDVPVARMFCDIVHHDGSPFAGDPRQVLRRQLERARELGFTFFAAPELEWFYFGGSDPQQALEPLDRGSYFEMTVNDIGSELRRKTVLTLEDMGIPVEYSQHEDAPSQHEIDLRYTDALSMADTVMTARLIVKEIAAGKGVHATFMPKPLAGVQGSGMHTHFSLFAGDANAFSDEADPDGLSDVAKGFIAGVLAHAREMTAVTNQWVNSYKRLVTGYEAPTAVAWARNNRSAIVNVPHPKKGRGEATRIEYRAPDPACNPYLAFAVVLAAGLQGIEAGYELPAPATENLYELTAEDRMATGLSVLPGSLAEAVDLMEGSSLMAEALGAHVFEWFLRNKRDEWSAYRTQVTQFELDRYLPTL